MRSLRCRLGFESQHSLKAVRVAVWRKTYINWDEKWQLRRIWSRINTDHSCFVSKRLPIPPKPHVLIGWKSRRHLDLLAANFAVFQKIFSIRRSLNFGDLLLGGSFFFQAENNVLLPSTWSLPGPSFEFLIALFSVEWTSYLSPCEHWTEFDSKKLNSLSYFSTRAVDVAQLMEQSLLPPEIHGLNPNIGKKI